MEAIHLIIKAFDDELINKDKEYLLLGQANKLLLDLELPTIQDNTNKVLKRLLEENKIPQAYQTENSPRQWRIPLSNNSKKRGYVSKQKSIQSFELDEKIKTKSLKCPHCNHKIIIEDEIINDKYLECNNCGNTIINTFVIKPKPINNEFVMTKSQKNWLIIIIICLVYLGYRYNSNNNNSNNNDSSNQLSNVFYLDETIYAAISEDKFDDMYQYSLENDDQALNSLILDGYIFILPKGTEVYLENTHLACREVRLKGSTQILWISGKHLKQR